LQVARKKIKLKEKHQASNKQQATSGAGGPANHQAQPVVVFYVYIPGAGGPANHQAQPVVVFYVYIPPSPAAVQV